LGVAELGGKVIRDSNECIPGKQSTNALQEEHSVRQVESVRESGRNSDWANRNRTGIDQY
jgi:hypothetical protein